jgi:hypothetical protein
MKRQIKISLLLMICAWNFLQAQGSVDNQPRLLVPRVTGVTVHSAPLFTAPGLFAIKSTAISGLTTGSAALAAPAPYRNRYSVASLPFFCKLEVHLERAVKIPIKFRLGDVQYVDRLEGKTAW